MFPEHGRHLPTKILINSEPPGESVANKRKGGSRRRMGRYIRGNIDENLLLGTLATKTLISDLWDDAVTEKALISSIVCTWSLDQLTSVQGPILFGVAHSDYSDAEIEAVIEASNSWNVGDLLAQEVGKRKVRIIGTFAAEIKSAELTDVRFADGRLVKTKLNWMLNTGQTLRMWAYNISASALATSDPAMRANGHANLWQR